MNHLDACINTRRIASETFTTALRQLLDSADPISEVMLRDLWLTKIREHTSIYPDGWYIPPPHGMFVVFATDRDSARVSPKSFRPPECWPRNDVFLDREHGLVAAYASPVDRDTSTIGDFGLTLYFGDNPEIQTLLTNALKSDYALFDELKVGLELSFVARRGAEILASHGLYSALSSPSDPTSTNIGHTIPGTGEAWSRSEEEVFATGDWGKIADTISHKRHFINAIDTTLITPNMAHTLEPRPQVPARPDLPMVWFHTIVVWRDGRKRFETGFNEIFKLVGMGYLLEI